MPDPRTEAHQPPYGAALVATGAVLMVYLATLAPTTWFWDASEYIATAHILGIPHPPGNPLFVVLGRAWNVLLGPFDLIPVPVRINLLAAVTTAAASGFFFLVAHRILADIVAHRRARLLGAFASVLIGATTYTVWNQSNVNEKVYTISVLVIAAVTWLALLWKDRQDDPKSVRYLVLAIFLMVLGSTNHLMSLLPAPALGLFVLMVRPHVLLDRSLLTRGVLAVVVGVSFNFFLPIRAAQNPIINEGDPRCDGVVETVVAVYSLGQAGCPALAANLTREQYQKPPLTERQAPLGHQLANYFQYFDWQWARGLDASEVPGNARLPVTLLFLGLGVAGLWGMARTDRDHFTYMATLAFTLTIALVYYLNFRHGWSLAPEGADTEVRERDYFFIASYIHWGVLAGIGLSWAWQALADRVRSDSRYLLSAPVLLVALVPLVANWSWADRSDDYSARDWAYNMLQSVAPYGIIFTNGDNDTFPLWYLQEVEEIRQDVTVIVVQYLFTPWYPHQLQYHTEPERQRPFREEQATGVYPVPRQPPSRSIIQLSPEEMDRIVGETLAQDTDFQIGDTVFRFPAGTFLNRGELMALHIIRDSADERPIHFASTAGLPQSLGVRDRVVREGLTYRLRLDDPEEDPSVVRIAPEFGGDWVDVERSLALARDVFTYRGFRERDIWPDRPTLNIPWHFYLMSLQVADAAERAGEGEEVVEALYFDAERFWITAQGGRRVVGSDD